MQGFVWLFGSCLIWKREGGGREGGRGREKGGVHRRVSSTPRRIRHNEQHCLLPRRSLTVAR